ncbi:MAG: hypothetical protein R2873_35770 [Caldilineaceae bacterium]
MPQVGQVGAGGAGRVHVEDKRAPFVEHVGLAMRRLDDDGVEAAGFLAEGPEE